MQYAASVLLVLVLAMAARFTSRQSAHFV